MVGSGIERRRGADRARASAAHSTHSNPPPARHSGQCVDGGTGRACGAAEGRAATVRRERACGGGLRGGVCQRVRLSAIGWCVRACGWVLGHVCVCVRARARADVCVCVWGGGEREGRAIGRQGR